MMRDRNTLALLAVAAAMRLPPRAELAVLKRRAPERGPAEYAPDGSPVWGRMAVRSQPNERKRARRGRRWKRGRRL